MSDTVKAYYRLQAEEEDIFLAKNADYGDSFRNHGALGVMVRLSDKLDRCINLMRKDGERAVKGETLRDTMLDIGNYAKMTIMAFEDGQGAEPAKGEGLTILPAGGKESKV